MFKYRDQGKESSIVLVSGWAFDERIFDLLELPFNMISYCKRSMADFEEDLLRYLAQKKLRRVSLLGWSQGALASGHFAARHPERIDRLILVSLSPVYETEVIREAKTLLLRNRRAYLRQFYKTCFAHSNLQSYRWFKQTLQRDYLGTFLADELCQALDWLSQAELRPEKLNAVQSISVIHGREDHIAPMQGTVQWAEKLPQAKLVLLEQGGHVPFLLDTFSRHCHEQQGHHQA